MIYQLNYVLQIYNLIYIKKVIRYMISSFKYIIYVLNVWKLKIENVTMNLIISLHHACIFVTKTKESNHLLIFSLINYKEQENNYVN